MKKKVTQILYSGLGGHAAVAFALAGAPASKRHIQSHMLFYGVEEVMAAYAEKCEADHIRWNGVHKRAGLDLASLKAVYMILRKQKPEIVILHSVNLIWLIYLAGLVFRFRTIAVEHQANHLKTKKDWIYSRLCLVLAHRVVYLTGDYKQEVQRRLPLYFRNNKVHVIPNGIDIDYFSPQQKAPGSVFTFGMLSRINDIKDHATLLKAFSLVKLPDTNLLIAGEGPTLALLKKLAAELKIEKRVVFAGLLEGEKVLDFFHGIDIYVHATLGETMSTSIMQAMACGLPVIASAVKGTENMITHGVNGLLVPVQNPDAFAGAMNELSGDKAKRQALAGEARKHAEVSFSSETMFLKYLDLIHESNS